MTSSDAIDEFVAGRAASTILFSPGLLNNNKEKMDFEVVFVPYPNESGEPSLEYLIGGPCVFNSGDSARIEAANVFVVFSWLMMKNGVLKILKRLEHLPLENQ